jgi:hypothetical protein
MQTKDYIILKNKDSHNGDYMFIPNKTISQLKTICEYTLDSFGFNTIGYFKKEILEKDTFSNLSNTDLYIRQDRITKIIKQKKDYLSEKKPLDITFVITTCKRLQFFIETMDKLIFHCQDLFLIKRWICVDDNSSEEDREIMKKQYPFFDFIMKTPEQRGHAKSLNIVLDAIKTKYVFFFEDDWRCNINFSILPYLEFLEAFDTDQIIFHGRDEKDGHQKLAMLNNKDIYKYCYNPNHPSKKVTKLCPYYEQFEKEFKCKSENVGYFYPGFSLNPSIFNIEKIHNHNLHFSEDLENKNSFEIRFAFECLSIGFKTSFSNILICHIGDISSYILNNTSRCFDVYSYNKRGVDYNFVECGSNPEWFVNTFPTWEEETFNVFETVKNKDKIAMDIGGWIGATCIWLCHNFKHVMVFEGDKVSRKSLELNCEASHCSNYTLINKPISNKESRLIFAINDKEQTDIGFIKINIKGEEENIIKDVLTFSSKNKIPVYISFYVDLWEDTNIKRFNDLFDVLTIKYKNKIINLEKFYNMLDENQIEGFLFC